MRYLIYVRVSTDQQDTNTQIENCNLYVDSVMKPGDTKVTISEGSMSSRIKMDDRPELQRMMAAIKKGDTVVVASFSRLARRQREMINIGCDIFDAGAHLHSLAQPGTNRYMLGIFASMAEMDLETISHQTKESLRAKKNRGELTGRPPYGYMLDTTRIQLREKVRSSGKPYMLIQNPKEAEIVQRVLELKAQDLSYREIAKQLNVLGYRNRAGKPFGCMTVQRIVVRQQAADNPLVSYPSVAV